MKQALYTLTGPTCSGKSHLHREMMRYGFGRLVSTTDRGPRVGEVEGVDYFFITTERSIELEEAGSFAELVTFNGVRYGVTKEEMETKMSDERPPVVILEPKGLKMYRDYCKQHGHKITSIFVQTSKDALVDRLTGRTVEEIDSLLQVRNPDCDYYKAALCNIIRTALRRSESILSEELNWEADNEFDLKVPGNDVSKAMSLILNLIETEKEL